MKIDCLIEDNLTFVKKANKKGINTILIKQAYNKDYKHKLNVFAESWLDVYCILGEKYDFRTNDLIEF